MDHATLTETARRWLADDPDPETRAAGEALLAAGDEKAIREHFGARLEFGTAGLRGALGPGPNRMNRAIVRRVTAGLADYVLAHVAGAADRGVVVGFDGRRGSREFAADTAAVLAGRGLAVHLFDDVVPTPELGHAVGHLNAAAGVMVTASHNPPEDNGYKVYWENAAQIIPPHDAGISAAVDRIQGLSEVAVPALDDLRAAGRVRPVPAEAEAAYRAEVAALRVHFESGVRIVYTPLHGVGRRLLEAVLRGAGHTDLHVVPEQAEPDGAFPTVRFPNPEEPGAMDLALALAREVGAELVIANDPDADRLAVAVPDGAGGFRSLSGNEVGLLLAEDLLTNGPQDPHRLVATTVVSSAMLQRIAAEHGVEYAETLTGFKWIANKALAYEKAGGRFVMGYEEALGYSAGPVVRDKDGISAALLFADLAAASKAEGRTILDELERLYRRYGLYLSAQRSVTLPGAEGAARIGRIMSGLRAALPAELGGTPVARVRDLATGTVTRADGQPAPALDLPPSDVLAFDLADGSRVLARPSGTEPKIKFYFEVREALERGEAVDRAVGRARARMAALSEDLLTRVGVR